MGEPLGCISSALSETSFCIYNVCIQNIHRAESLVTANTMNSRKIFLVIVNLWGKLDQCVWKDQYVMQLISGNLEIREHLCNDEKLWPYCWLMILKDTTRCSSGTRLTKAYDVTMQRYRNSHAKLENSKMYILRCMGSKFCVKFQRCPLKFHTKFWTHTPQNFHFTMY